MRTHAGKACVSWIAWPKTPVERDLRLAAQAESPAGSAAREMPRVRRAASLVVPIDGLRARARGGGRQHLAALFFPAAQVTRRAPSGGVPRLHPLPGEHAADCEERAEDSDPRPCHVFSPIAMKIRCRRRNGDRLWFAASKAKISGKREDPAESRRRPRCRSTATDCPSRTFPCSRHRAIAALRTGLRVFERDAGRIDMLA